MNKEIFRLAIPNILSNVSIPLISAVDTALMGRISASYLAALGIGTMIFNFFYWNFGFLRMGTTGMTAQAFGASDKAEIQSVLLKSLSLALLLAVLFLLCRPWILEISLFLLDAREDQTEAIREYFVARSWDAPASFLLYAILGWYFGMQNALIPLLITLSVNLLNLMLSIYFVQAHGMGIQGVALGTVIAQYSGVLIGIVALLKYYKSYIPNPNLLRSIEFWRFRKWSHFLHVNKDLFIRTVSLTGAFAFFYRESSGLGTIVLASNVVLLQFLSWISHGIDGIAFAAESICGKYLGMKDRTMLYKAMRYSFWYGLLFALMYALIFSVFGSYITKIFSTDPLVIETSKRNMAYLATLPLVAFACYIWDGIFIGLTWSRQLRDSMILAFLIYIGSYYILNLYDMDRALWLAFLYFMAARGIIQSIMWKQNKFRLSLGNFPI